MFKIMTAAAALGACIAVGIPTAAHLAVPGATAATGPASPSQSKPGRRKVRRCFYRTYKVPKYKRVFSQKLGVWVTLFSHYETRRYLLFCKYVRV